MYVTCYACAAENEFKGSVGRRDTCEGCNVELRCCLQCKYYDESTPNLCAEPAAEVPREKDEGNFCEFFKPGTRTDRDADAQTKAKSAFEALFKK